jgi:hypothetical protein
MTRPARPRSGSDPVSRTDPRSTACADPDPEPARGSRSAAGADRASASPASAHAASHTGAGSASPAGLRSALIRGSVMHARSDEHARRAFRYPVYVAAIDLAELPALDRGLRLFSHGGRNLFALHDRDYEDGARGLRTALGDLLDANGLPVPHTTRLVTNLRVAGYVFNPVSFFLNYDAGGDLVSVVAEVNNTYGGRRRYVLGPADRIVDRTTERAADRTVGLAAERAADLPDESLTADRAADPHGGSPSAPGRTRVGFRHVRELFVSPFLHGPAIYEFWFDAPLDGDRLAITMRVVRPSGERIFVARLAGHARTLSDRTLIAAALRYPVMTAQVIGLIHLEAVKLRWRGVPYIAPGPGHRPHLAVPVTRDARSRVPAAADRERLK